MLEGVKGIFAIVILCITLIIASKLIYLIKYVINNDKVSIIDEIKGLDYESFYYLALESLTRKSYEDFSIINENILKCTKDNEEYMVVLNNGEDSFIDKDGEVFHGYMVIYGIKKILFFMPEDLQQVVKKFFSDTDVEVISYNNADIIDDYINIIKNI